MSRVAFVVAILLVTALGVAWGMTRANHDYLPGDCPYYAFTADSLLLDGDLDLTNQLAPGATGSEIPDALRPHSAFFAAGPGGKIVPKHSVLMPALALPFRAAFGRVGFLVFNVVQLVLLVYAVSVLAGNTPTARIVALVGFASSPLVFHAYNFSPDILGALLVVMAYIAAGRGRWVWCGVCAGLAVWAKVYLAVVVLPAGLMVLAGGWRGVVTCVLGGLAALTPMLVLNAVLYGGPFITGYDLQAAVQPDGSITTRDHYSLFNQPMLPGLSRLLFNARLGAVPTAPLWTLWLVGVWFLWRAGERARAAAFAAGIMANLLVFAPYEVWDATEHGNRFLFPAFALGFAAQGPFWESIRARRKPVE